jgi:hypothetical protein
MQHGSQRLPGPLRGVPAWWRSQDATAGAHLSADGTPPTAADTTPGRDDKGGIRWELVRRVRREIAAGAYDTPERWEAALDRLLDQLDD